MHKYSKEQIFPEDIIDLCPYRQTFEALANEDEEALNKLLSNFALISMQNVFKRFEHIESKREKKDLMKCHVYLDAVLTLHRMPNQISNTLEFLSEKMFKGLNVEAIRAILEKFTEVQHLNKSDMGR